MWSKTCDGKYFIQSTDLTGKKRKEKENNNCRTTIARGTYSTSNALYPLRNKQREKEKCKLETIVEVHRNSYGFLIEQS